MSAQQPNEGQTVEDIAAAAAEDVKAMIGRLEQGRLLRMSDTMPGMFVSTASCRGNPTGRTSY